ncbi:MAG: DUF1820 family protein [Arenicellales bacterium]|jgi:hypothetical protein|nr:DUF1820 family protein [Arenicellales bacterium]MDP7284014.1 DUF1820 family protein [Arenicellales bacterium]MDP7481445.1 DUF1820 family protein [Arenicellales bacterium]MDP7522193.1 DUF1820 family protein [Arenicellales bacterium]HJL65554.1 DUF1820 family protein [Arenicellales bacterium]|tara:strand:+ start:1071 stop:1412 length:342 start_codon:yes stop_codon:yes gene_type:complete
MAKSKHIYRVIFQSQGKVIELYAREVSQNQLFAFVEIAELSFGERSQLVVDPSEEQLKSEFSGVRRTFIPLHSVIRIDEVEKEGVAKIRPAESESSGNITPFPVPMPPGGIAE